MNTLDHFLLKQPSREKLAFDQSIRNFGVDALMYGGNALRNFEKNPMVSSAVLGAGIGATHGAMTAEPGESRTRKGLRNAIAGGLAGGAVGGLMSGSVRNLGRYGGDIADDATAIRGADGLRDARVGDFAQIMRDNVFSSSSARGGKRLQGLREAHDAAEAAAAASGTPEAAQRVREARKALNDAGGGLGTRFSPLIAAGSVAGASVAGAKIQDYREKNSSLRIREVLDKQANFGALAAKAVGFGAQGAGKAIQMGAANPALAGAAIGAAGGAIAGGEGNRLKGALGGAALGAGAGAGLAKLAPQATANMQQFGKTLSATGKGAVGKAGKDGATFASSMKPFDALKNTRAQFAKENITHSIADQGKTLLGNGMSGGAAAGTALAGVGAAGLAGGALGGSLGQNTPANQASANAARQRFSNVAMV